MLLKEFPVFHIDPAQGYSEVFPEIPRKLYKILEMVHQRRIPHSNYSIDDLEGLMKSFLAQQRHSGRSIEMDGGWSLVSIDSGMPWGVILDLVLFPTCMILSIMTLFWYRYPAKAKRLEGFQDAIQKGLNVISRFSSDLRALRILQIGDVFKYAVEHADDRPGCHTFVNELIKYKKRLDADCNIRWNQDFYQLGEEMNRYMAMEIRHLHRSLAILPNRIPWKTNGYFTWKAQCGENADHLVIVEAPYGTPPKAEVHTDTIANELAMTRGVACILGGYSKKHYRHTTFKDKADRHILSEYRDTLKDILKNAGAVDSSGKATKKVLHLVIRALADRRGVDFEISTRNDRACSENLSRWLMDVFEKILDEFNAPWRSFTVQKNRLFQGGSPFLEVNRNGEAGDDTFNGFGENYNAMEIRISRGTRNSYPDRLIDMIGKLIDAYR